MYYKNSEEIVTFINKAQNKIAELTTLMVKRKSIADMWLVIELLNFIETLDDEYCIWDEDKISQFIEHYNTVADLNSIPYLALTGYKVNVVGGSYSKSKSLYTSDILDYIQATKALITSTPHNQLKDIQGGNDTERYHLTKEQYDKLLALITKEPTVSLNLVSSTPSIVNGVYEKGTTITRLRVRPGVTLNDGGAHTSSRYLLGITELVNYTTDNLLREYEYTGAISENSTIKFQASFSKATMKEASVSVRFEAPYFSAIDTANKLHTSLVLTKGLGKAGNTIIDFSIPAGNATASNPVFPYVLFPESWGTIKSVGEASSTFDYKASFKHRGIVSRTLADGTPINYNMYEYGTATQGNMIFTFRF